MEENIGITMKTPDTRDLIKQSQASQKTGSQHVNQKYYLDHKRAGDKGGHEETKNERLNAALSKKKSHHTSYQASLVELEDDGAEFSETELEALDMSRERKKFASNMFGSDFKPLTDNKDETMRILQEKSFRGLYLRL